MNKLEFEVCRILDFPEKYLSTAKSEAVDKGKLRNTWLFVNGTLTFAHSFDFQANMIVCEQASGDTKLVNIGSLSTFIPESGLYSTELGVLSVTKKASKSWVKSFKPDNYIIYHTGNTTKKIGQLEIRALALAKSELITTDIFSRIWMYGVKEEVAVFTDKEEVNVINSKYYQEVLDYVNRKELQCPVNLL